MGVGDMTYALSILLLLFLTYVRLSIFPVILVLHQCSKKVFVVSILSIDLDGIFVSDVFLQKSRYVGTILPQLVPAGTILFWGSEGRV